MKRRWIRLATLVLAMVLISGVVSAGTYRSPILDTSCDASACYTGFELLVQASGPISGGGSTCTPDLVSYIKWDLTANAASTIGHARLTLVTLPSDQMFVTTPGTYTFALVAPNNHTWVADGANPGYGAVLATSSPTVVTAAGGEQVVFSSDALGAYFNGLKGGVASVGVVLTNGCTTPTHVVVLQDRGSVSEPDLVFYPEPGPNSVALSGFEAGNAAASWPVYAGLGALAVIVLAGGALALRKRAATR